MNGLRFKISIISCKSLSREDYDYRLKLEASQIYLIPMQGLQRIKKCFSFQRPIFLLVAAGKRILPSLIDELNGIQGFFRTTNCDLDPINEAKGEDILNALGLDKNKRVNRLVGFHFSGHANNNKLFIIGPDGKQSAINGLKLAAVFERCPNLKFVFLNGCATLPIVKAFHDIGVDYVIATSRNVEDKSASEFAKIFYEKALKYKKSLLVSFDQAVKELHIKGFPANIKYRDDILLENNKLISGSCPWGLYPSDQEKNPDNYYLYCTNSWQTLAGAIFLMILIALSIPISWSSCDESQSGISILSINGEPPNQNISWVGDTFQVTYRLSKLCNGNYYMKSFLKTNSQDFMELFTERVDSAGTYKKFIQLPDSILKKGKEYYLQCFLSQTPGFTPDISSIGKNNIKKELSFSTGLKIRIAGISTNTIDNYNIASIGASIMQSTDLLTIKGKAYGVKKISLEAKPSRSNQDVRWQKMTTIVVNNEGYWEKSITGRQACSTDSEFEIRLVNEKLGIDDGPYKLKFALPNFTITSVNGVSIDENIDVLRMQKKERVRIKGTAKYLIPGENIFLAYYPVSVKGNKGERIYLKGIRQKENWEVVVDLQQAHRHELVAFIICTENPGQYAEENTANRRISLVTK